MAEEVKEEVIHNETVEKKESVLEAILKHLAHECEEIKIGVEFSCGSGFKKVVNAVKAIEVYTFLILFPPDHEALSLKAFGEDGVIEKEILKAIAIPIDRICSIEIDPKEVDHHEKYPTKD